MPVAPQVRLFVRNHHDVEGAGGDRPVAARADVGLPGGVRLDRGDAHRLKIAHSTPDTAAATASTTMATSTESLRCGRNGLKPMDDDSRHSV